MTDLAFSHEKQVNELKEKGYFIMADGTKSTDVVVAKKKKVKSETKAGGKRESAIAKDKPKAAPPKEKKKPAPKKEVSEDDLDIEGDSGSPVEESV